MIKRIQNNVSVKRLMSEFMSLSSLVLIITICETILTWHVKDNFYGWFTNALSRAGPFACHVKVTLDGQLMNSKARMNQATFMIDFHVDPRMCISTWKIFWILFLPKNRGLVFFSFLHTQSKTFPCEWDASVLFGRPGPAWDVAN